MEINKERLIAFTDAIIAIAATIMVLELVTPSLPTFEGLFSQWPVFVAYITSFVFIYIVWYNHHNAFDKINRLSTKVFLLNGVWLFALTLVPFTTRWVGEHPFATAPEFLYAFVLLLWSLAFQIMDNQILKEDPTLKPDSTNNFIFRALLYGCLIIAMIASFFMPILSLVIIFVVFIPPAIYILATSK